METEDTTVPAATADGADAIPGGEAIAVPGVRSCADVRAGRGPSRSRSPLARHPPEQSPGHRPGCSPGRARRVPGRSRLDDRSVLLHEPG